MEDTVKKPRGRGRGTTRGRGRGKGRGRGRGRTAKAAAVVESDDEQMLEETDDTNNKSIEETTQSPLLDKSPPTTDSKPTSPSVTGGAAVVSAVVDAVDASAGTVAGAGVAAGPTDASSTTTDAADAKAPTALASNTNESSAAAAVPVVVSSASLPPTIDMEADISQLEAPTFTTLSRGPPQPMTRLKWDHKVNLIGEKIPNPMIHCCDKCENVKPIMIYGRMIPCKHVFCLKCGRDEPCPRACPRCKEKVVRVEQSGLGTVFMCTHGGSRYGTTGCRRTYLSQRDLQAHINHRHMPLATLATAGGYK